MSFAGPVEFSLQRSRGLALWRCGCALAAAVACLLTLPGALLGGGIAIALPVALGAASALFGAVRALVDLARARGTSAHLQLDPAGVLRGADFDGSEVCFAVRHVVVLPGLLRFDGVPLSSAAGRAADADERSANATGIVRRLCRQRHRILAADAVDAMAWRRLRARARHGMARVPPAERHDAASPSPVTA